MEHSPTQSHSGLKSRIASSVEGLFEADEGTTLAVFRIVFGVLTAGEAFYRYLGDVGRVYSPDDVHFTYSFFHWVAPWPSVGMQLHIVIMGLAAIGIALGLFYRVCCVMFTVLYTYLFLIEATTYNNHYYLFILLGLLFCVTNAHSALSLDRLRKPDALNGAIRVWNVVIFRAQIVVLYFYGGVAKINSDWLHGEPARLWITHRQPYPQLERIINDEFIRLEWVVMMISYGGLFFDLLIGFALLNRRTRLVALPFLLFFHATNMVMFSDIGVFPVFAILSTVLFFPGDMPRRVMGVLGATLSAPEARPPSGPERRKVVCMALALYMAVQIVTPLRHWAYPGNVSWTEEGHLLAWHMKVRSKSANAEFIVKDANGNVVARIRREQQLQDMHAHKRSHMLIRPQLVIQYAHHLRDRYREQGIESPEVYVNLRASLNGRPYQPLIDPNTDLASAHYSPIWPAPWILPLADDLPIGKHPN